MFIVINIINIIVIINALLTRLFSSQRILQDSEFGYVNSLGGQNILYNFC